MLSEESNLSVSDKEKRQRVVRDKTPIQSRAYLTSTGENASTTSFQSLSAEQEQSVETEQVSNPATQPCNSDANVDSIIEQVIAQNTCFLDSESDTESLPANSDNVITWGPVTGNNLKHFVFSETTPVSVLLCLRII